jgi:CheY-like chemotaxis protein
MGQGTGLGLAISRQFARALKGDIRVTSEPGRGSIFRFTFEATMPALLVEVPDAGQRVVGITPGITGVRVLVADDQADNRDLLVRLLAPLGFETKAAGDGSEAVRLVAAWQPALVVMDARMPGLDGLSATRQIRASAQGEATRIIVVSAGALDETRAEALAAGADGFLPKPFRDGDLLAEIARLTGVRYVWSTSQPGVPPAPAPAGAPPAAGPAPRPERLPSGLVAALRAAAEIGDRAELLRLLPEVAGHDATLAAGLRPLAERYDYEALLAALG